MNSSAALRRVFANPDLRRLQLALAAAMLGGAGYQVALAIVAFEAGGPRAVGIAFAIQILPLALAAPLTSAFADRFPRRRVMVVIDALRFAGSAAVAAAVAGGGSLALVLALGAPGAIASTAYAPATRALLPSLAREPGELTAANAVSTGIQHAALLAGPAIAGLLVAVGDAAWSFGFSALLFGASGVVVLRLRGGREAPAGAGAAGSRLSALTAGLRTLGADRGLRALVGVYAVITGCLGALDVFAVVLARELTSLGDAGVGVLFSALGFGGIAGAGAALRLNRASRLAAPLVGGGVVWGVALAVLAAAPSTAMAIGGLAVVGAANVVIDVAIVTILQRSVPDEVLGRAFGVMESVLVGMFGLGALVAPFVAEGIGQRGALAVLAAAVPVVVALRWRRLRGAELGAAMTERVRFLSGVDMLATLPAPAVEALARCAVDVEAADGEVIVAEGEAGDRFYVVRDGRVSVEGGGRALADLGPGEGFGEMALLRDAPRAATVTARGPVLLYALERDAFVAAVTGHPASSEAVAAVIATRLGRGLPPVAAP